MRAKKFRRKPDYVPQFLRHQREGYDDIFGSAVPGFPRKGMQWFACDEVGQIAALSSRDFGHVPRCLSQFPRHRHVEIYEQFLRAMVGSGNGDDEVDYPQLGLYYFEVVDPVSDGYHRLGVPAVPLNVHDCTERVRELLVAMRYDGKFAETAKLWVRKHWKCVVGYI